MARTLKSEREAEREYTRAYYATHPEYRQRAHERYMANRELRIERMKQYYDKNKLEPDFVAKRRATSRAYYLRHREELKEKALLKMTKA